MILRADQNYYFLSQLERADSFSHRKHNNSKKKKKNLLFFFWVLANFVFLVVHTYRLLAKSCKYSKSRDPFCRTSYVHVCPRGWVLRGCVSGFFRIAWMRLPLKKKLVPWMQLSRHADSVCCCIHFISNYVTMSMCVYTAAKCFLWSTLYVLQLVEDVGMVCLMLKKPSLRFLLH